MCNCTDVVGEAALGAALAAVRHCLRQASYLRDECSRDGSFQPGGPSQAADLDEATWKLITGALV